MGERVALIRGYRIHYDTSATARGAIPPQLGPVPRYKSDTRTRSTFVGAIIHTELLPSVPVPSYQSDTRSRFTFVPAVIHRDVPGTRSRFTFVAAVIHTDVPSP